MELNTIKPGRRRLGTPSRRVGRGIGSGLGKTAVAAAQGPEVACGRFSQRGFEGGQMPLQRRLPKRGFKSLRCRQRRGHLTDLERSDQAEVDVLAEGRLAWWRLCKDGQGHQDGRAERAVVLTGIGATAGAKAAIGLPAAGLIRFNPRLNVRGNFSSAQLARRKVRDLRRRLSFCCSRWWSPHRRAHSPCRHRPDAAAAAVQGQQGAAS